MEPKLLELYAEGSPDDEVAVILRLTDPTALPDGVRIVAQFDLIATCRLPRREIPRVRGATPVWSMKAAQFYGPTPAPNDWAHNAAPDGSDDLEKDGSGDENPGEAALEPMPTDQRRPEGDLPTGRGVVVAHIDWGVDFAHPDFREADGKTRLLALWDQSSPVDPQRPNRYGYGRIYDASDIDRALAAPDPYAALGYDPGFRSHGTHTLSISAGNGRSGGPVGLAPEADLIFVHLSTYTAEGPTLLGDSVALLEAFDFIARMAGPRPLVVNCSLGRHAGQHDGKTLTEQGVDAFLLAAPGRAAIWSCGNYFDRQIHARGTLRPGESRTLRLITDVADRTPNEVDLWYPGVDRFQITLRGPGGTPEVHAGPGERSSVIVDGREVGRLYHRLYDPNNGDNQITLFLYRAAPAGEWELTLFGEDVADGRYHAWVERDAACKGCQARFAPDDSDPTSTLGTICTGLRTLAVGAYDAHQDEHPLAPFSSCGPTRDGREGTPALVAPGVRVLAACSRPPLGGPDQPLQTRMSGTSMAAPHVTGTAALMFAAAGRPLFIEETRRLLLAHTDPVSEDASPTERLRLGSGYLNTAAAVAAAEQAGRRPAVFVAPVSGEMRADSNQKNQSERYELMSVSSDPTAGPEVAESDETAPAPGEVLADSDEKYEPIIESSDEATNYEPTEYEDAEAKRDHRRQSRLFNSTSPFQIQIPLTGSAPALAIPVGGYRSPFAFTVPLGATPPAASPLSGQAGAPTVPSASQPGGPDVPKPPVTPAWSAPPVPASEPATPEPSAPEPFTTEPPVTVASPDFPLYLPPAPGDMGTQGAEQPAEFEEYAAEAKRDTRFSPSPFQVQIPLTGGGAALAVPVGGSGSPLAFTVPLGGTPPAPVQTDSPTQPPATEPFTSEPPVTVASPDFPLYVPPPEAEVDVEAMEQPEAWQELDTSEWSSAEWDVPMGAEFSEDLGAETEPAEFFSMSEAIPDFGEQVLAAAEAAAESDDTLLLSTAALLGLLLGPGTRAGSEVEGETIPLSPLGHQAPAPSATTLFNAFVYPNHPLFPRNALHRHYARRFQVLAYPGQAMPDLDPRPGDLFLRVAQGQGWGHVAVVASGDLYRHDRLGDVGLRGEGYPRLLPGLYIQVVEVGPRRRRRADRFARRLSDGAGLVLPDTLLLRPLPPGGLSREAEAEAGYVDSAEFADLAGCPLAEDVGFAEQPAPPPAPAAPAGPDSSVANRFVAAHPTRYCTPGQAGSATCLTLAAPRPIRRVVIHALAVPSTARRSGVEAVVAGWQNAGRQASSHYLVDRDGTITQMVREADVAFHTPGNNRDSIGIEHADVCNDPAPLTTQLYERSAALVRDLATRHGFAINNNTVAGHSQVNPNHGDPGPYWDWEYYFLLLAWAGMSAASRPIRLMTAAASRAAAPTGWQVQRRRAIANDHCASRRDPWGATYWRAQPSVTGTAAELSLVVDEACTYKVSLWWPDVSGANPAVPVDIEVGCLTSPCTGTSTQTVTVNQRPNAGRWNDVAVVTVTQTPAEVKVRWRRNSAQPGWILADGVRLLKIASCPVSVSSGGSGEAETAVTGAEPDTSVPCPPPATVLDRFGYNLVALAPHHRPILEAVARDIAASQSTDSPVHTVCFEGHADSSGPTQYNQEVGLRRARNAKAGLDAALEALRPGLSRQVGRMVLSRGEEVPVADNATLEGRARNRRVEIFLNRRWNRPAPQAASARIDVLPLREALDGELFGEADPVPESVVPVGSALEVVGTGTPLPPGSPGFTWSIADPAVARFMPLGDAQASPNRVSVSGVRPGRTTLRMTYKPAVGGSAQTQRDIIVAGAKVAELLDPPGKPCVAPLVGELVRPLSRSGGVAHRTVKLLFEPASFWAGKTVEWTFTPEGAVRGTLPAGHATQLEATTGFNFTATTRRSVVRPDGTVAVRVNLPPVSLNRGRLEAFAVDQPQLRASLLLEVPGVAALDAGHGGSANLPGSSSNNAVSVSGVLEKTMTLDLVLRVRDALLASPRLLQVHLSRDDDFNVAGAERARLARCRGADVLLSIHFNGDNNAAIRGTVSFVAANTSGNVNRAEDLAFAQRIQTAAAGAIPGGRNVGVRDDTQTGPGQLAVLNDTHLGNTAALHPTRSCLLEVEFITNAAADAQFNTAANRIAFKNSLAQAIADAIVADLQA